MQKNKVEVDWERIRSDIRIDLASDLLDSTEYFVIMKHPNKGLLQYSTDPRAAKRLLDSALNTYGS